MFFDKGIRVGKKFTIFTKKFSGNNIRNLIIKSDKKWRTLVPNEVIEIIKEIDGINRIKNIYKKGDTK